jgi:tetratricopeptide (TPR) repeat protein
MIRALEMVGMTRGMLGDAGGLDDIARAAELAEANGNLGELRQALNQLSATKMVLGDVRGSTESRLTAAAVAERIGSEGELRWSQGVLADHHYRMGRWDEAVRLCDGLLAGPRHYLSGQAWMVRGAIRAARGDAAGALADTDEAVAHARRIEQPQVLYYVFQLGAYVFAAAGAPERGELLAREHLEILVRGDDLQFGVVTIPAFAAAARLLGLDAELEQALVERAPSPWIDASRAYARGNYVEAAAALDRIGSLPDEAEARLRAAERLAAQGRRDEAEEQLRRARTFYESVTATAHVGIGVVQGQADSVVAAARAPDSTRGNDASRATRR